MNFYQQVGVLVLGTRLKRLSEYFLSEVNKVYSDAGIEFEASWFAFFYLLNENEELSLVEIAKKLEVSHSAVSQLAKVLQQKNLIVLANSVNDGRKKNARFSARGKQLMLSISPVWNAMERAMNQLLAEEPLSSDILQSIFAVEDTFKKYSLHQRIQTEMRN